MPMKSRAKDCGTIGFNIVPLIDCVFQLLLFLMVTRHFYELSTVEVQLPPASRAESKQEELMNFRQLVINIVPPRADDPKKETQIFVNGEVIVRSYEGGEVPNWDPLIALLKNFKNDPKAASNKPVNVILRAGDNVPYETIGSVMLSTSTAGIKHWWMQAYRVQNTAQDEPLKDFLGVSSGGGN